MDAQPFHRRSFHLYRRLDHRRRFRCTALTQGRAISQAMTAIAQQPDEAPTITRTSSSVWR